MSTVRRLAAILLVTVVATPAPGGDLSHATRRQLRELAKLCDAGVVAPAACLEKQRTILGLSGGGAATAGTPAADARRTHDSPLGFRVELPAGWSVVTPAQLDAGFDVLRERLAADPAALALVDRLRAQRPHRRGEVYAAASDHVQVIRSPSPLPDDPAARTALCTQLGAATSKAAGRALATHTCRTHTIAGRPALLIERDALLPGSHTLQYWVATPDGGGLAFVMSCRAENAATRREELVRLVAGLRWPGS